VSGLVTNDQGTPMANVAVTMRYWLGGFISAPSVLTDASGGYTIGFTSNPWDNANGRGAARAEVVAEGYDLYTRTVLATGPHLVESFRLHRHQRVTAGDSIVVSVTSDNGDCLGWLYGPCGRTGIAVTINGNLTIEAVPTQPGAALPQLEVCCVTGSERYGNPVTVPVKAGTEMSLEIGQASAGVTTSQTVIVRTSLEPF
jgi:hypothetical protein